MLNIWRKLALACILALLLNSGAVLMAAHPFPQQRPEPLRQEELSRFVHDLPFFLRWARGQGLVFEVYPDSTTLFAPDRKETTRRALRRAGWKPERFAFLLCATGAAATACPPSCGRPLSAEERALLEAHMLQLLDAYGTGP